MKTSSKILYFSIIFTIGAIVALGWSLIAGEQSSIRVTSIGDGQAYYSTTTDSTWNQAPFYKTIRSGYGTFGSVIITTSSAAPINIYDGTTTDATKRTNPATTTIARFAASAAAGTYTFDVSFTTGLLVETQTGAGGIIASTTITWR